jgi:hypothetical protein
MNSLIRMAEVWVPSADTSLLEWSSGAYAASPAFGALSQTLCFGRAEGLPGHAWDEGRPILLPTLTGSYFMRTPAALAAGVQCALAWPIFAQERLCSVVVLLCGDPAAHGGAIELWHNDPRITGDLTLSAGCFGLGAEELASLARDAYLPRGSGLPGLAWQQEAAVWMDTLSNAKHFLRAEPAERAGLVHGLGLPCAVPGRHTWVLALLAARHHPIAARLESWRLDQAQGLWHRSFGHDHGRGALGSQGPGRPTDSLPASWQTTLGSGVASISGDLTGTGLPTTETRRMLAWPIASDHGFSELLVIYL